MDNLNTRATHLLAALVSERETLQAQVTDLGNSIVKIQMLVEGDGIDEGLEQALSSLFPSPEPAPMISLPEAFISVPFSAPPPPPVRRIQITADVNLEPDRISFWAGDVRVFLVLFRIAGDDTALKDDSGKRIGIYEFRGLVEEFEFPDAAAIQ